MSVACGAKAFACVCSLDAGHQGAHHCTKDDCGGMWRGNPDDDTFRSVQLPRGTGPLAGLSDLLQALFGADERPEGSAKQ